MPRIQHSIDSANAAAYQHTFGAIREYALELGISPNEVLQIDGELRLTERGRRALVAGERWASLPDSSSHLPRGPQRFIDPPPGKEETLIRPVRMDVPAALRRGWWVEVAPRGVRPDSNVYAWLLVRWREPGSSIVRLWRALIAWIDN